MVSEMKASLIMILSFFVMTMLLIPSVPVTEGQEVNDQFSNVHVNLRAEDKFSPELNHVLETEPTVKRVTAQWSNGIVPGSRVAEWTPPVSWESDPIKGPMTIQGTVKFNLWYDIIDEGFTGSPDWRFNLFLNDESIAYVQRDDSSNDKDNIVEVTASTDLNGTTEIKSGDVFRVDIQYHHVEDVDLYYDNFTYDSGVSIQMNSIRVFKATNSFSVRFYDAWGINWNNEGKYFCDIATAYNATYDHTEIEVKDSGTVNENGTEYQTVTLKFNNVEIEDKTDMGYIIAYGKVEGDDFQAFNALVVDGGGGDDSSDDGDDDIDMVMVGGGGAVAAIAILAVVWIFVIKPRRETGDEDEEDYEDYEEDEEV